MYKVSIEFLYNWWRISQAVLYDFYRISRAATEGRGRVRRQALLQPISDGAHVRFDERRRARGIIYHRSTLPKECNKKKNGKGKLWLVLYSICLLLSLRGQHAG